MGEGSEETMKEIEDARDALGEKVDELTSQIKMGVDSAKSKAMKIGGIALAAIAGIITLKKIRRR